MLSPAMEKAVKEFNDPQMYTLEEIGQIVKDSERWNGNGDFTIKIKGRDKVTMQTYNYETPGRDEIVAAAKAVYEKRKEKEVEVTPQEKAETVRIHIVQGEREKFMNPEKYTIQDLEKVIEGAARWNGLGDVVLKDGMTYHEETSPESRAAILSVAKKALEKRKKQEKENASKVVEDEREIG